MCKNNSNSKSLCIKTKVLASKSWIQCCMLIKWKMWHWVH
jgi:hypothetical protein